MLFAYKIENATLTPLAPDAALSEADWIDLYRPQPEQLAQVEALGYDVPSLADMEEIEISNRFYRTGNVDVLTVSLPGLDAEKARSFGPVACLLSPSCLVTVRFHAPRPFETLAAHAAGSSAGCTTIARLFLSLMEEIVARMADLLEGVGRELDDRAARLFTEEGIWSRALQDMLREVGRSGEMLAKYRLSLLTLERALSTFGLSHDDKDLRPLTKARGHDIQALLVHADFLSGRISHLTDVILGMVTLEQGITGRIVSVVAVIFLPPTLVASVYGMNFGYLPGMDSPHGYLIATGLMTLSALGTLLFFRWKGWL
ncbi:CorA family divalent cation transporter [Phaeobacter sp. B1627]|uniref:CorA family divalent cation transporter n=1 Tax=Phaeobacter sp. B1627 TaxID=2583809 RepID=UPI0011194CAE|nr:CorA family divalent cation transporter [Phaeobacter sp. B1627]TNJ47726.1 magnesium transporter [Phaeobacter sp. B1627]